MQKEIISSDTINFICIFKACSIARDVEMGIKSHVKIVSNCFLFKDITLGNALVDMYANCGLSIKAQNVLDELPLRDVVSWFICMLHVVCLRKQEKYWKSFIFEICWLGPPLLLAMLNKDKHMKP